MCPPFLVKEVEETLARSRIPVSRLVYRLWLRAFRRPSQLFRTHEVATFTLFPVQAVANLTLLNEFLQYSLHLADVQLLLCDERHAGQFCAGFRNEVVYSFA